MKVALTCLIYRVSTFCIFQKIEQVVTLFYAQVNLRIGKNRTLSLQFSGLPF